jgi:hypothetical protein
VTDAKPSPRLGWVLLVLVVLIVSGGGWALVEMAERTMKEAP